MPCFSLNNEKSVDVLCPRLVLQVGVFPEFAGMEYENFMAVAGNMRTDYDFFHTSDATILPRGAKAVKGPLLRLFKPFDELFVDSQVNQFFSDDDDLMCMHLIA
jgi:protein disulfide-isomerase A1